MTKNHSFKELAQLGLFLMLSIASISCQKVIDVDLNSSSPRIVIEGSISDGRTPCTVKISRTVNFNQPSTFPPVEGAVVRLSDPYEHTVTLTEVTPGTYSTSAISGHFGIKYTITVSVDGQTYVASSTMPIPVTIESLSLQNFTIGRNSSLAVVVYFFDPEGVSNYYRFVEQRNGITQNFIFLMDDRAQDGTYMNSILFAEKDTIKVNDTIKVFLQCVDKNVYDFYTTAQQISDNQEGPQSASPTNPPSNFSNGALGCFSAYTERSDEIIIR